MKKQSVCGKYQSDNGGYGRIYLGREIFSGREKAMKGKRFVVLLVLIALSLCGCNGLKKGQTYNLNDWWVNAYGVNIWWALNVL